MRAATLSESEGDVEIRVGTEDPQVAARRVAVARGMTSGRVIVHGTSTPRWADQQPVRLSAWFRVIRFGVVRWEFATAGGSDDGV
jgi:hypothetical protein